MNIFVNWNLQSEEQEKEGVEIDSKSTVFSHFINRPPKHTHTHTYTAPPPSGLFRLFVLSSQSQGFPLICPSQTPPWSTSSLSKPLPWGWAENSHIASYLQSVHLSFWSFITNFIWWKKDVNYDWSWHHTCHRLFAIFPGDVSLHRRLPFQHGHFSPHGSDQHTECESPAARQQMCSTFNVIQGQVFNREGMEFCPSIHVVCPERDNAGGAAQCGVWGSSSCTG